MSVLTEYLKNRQSLTEEKPRFDIRLQAWLDRLLRDQYASVAVAKRILEGRPEEIPEAIRRGLTGVEKGSYRDIAEEYDLPAPFWWGLAGDIFLSPLTYLPVGAIAKWGGKTLAKIPPIAKAGKALYASKPIQSIGKAMIPYFRPTGISPEVWAKIVEAKRLAKNIEALGTDEALKFSKSLADNIRRIMKKGAIQQDDLTKIIASIEKKSFKFGLPNEVRPIYDKLLKYWEELGKRRAKIGKTLLSDDEYNYFLRQLSKSELEKLQKTGLDIGFKEIATKTASDIARKYWKVITPEGVEKGIQRLTKSQQKKLLKQGYKLTQPTQLELKAAREAYLAGKSKVYIPEFTSDIPYLAYLGGRRMARAEAGQAFFDFIKANPSLYSTTPIEGWVKSTAPELKGLYFNPHLVKEIDLVRKAFVSEETTKDLIRLFDSMQNYWKLQTLGLFPSYHFRNFIGNLWNNYLGGVVNPLVYKKAFRIQQKVARGIPLDTKEKLIYDLARKYGVIGRGFYGREIPSVLPELAPTRFQQFIDITKRPAQFGMEKFGRNIEDNARLTHFIDKYRKGWSPQEAALSVKKYLFDYGELTDFEKNVLRRLMPFYSWTRKNLPLQVEALLKRPGKVLPIEKARRSLAQGIGSPPEEFMPEWVRERMPVTFAKRGREYSYFPLESWLPYADISKLERPTEILGELLSPIIRTPLELVQNRSWYFEAPIERYKGETREFLRKDIPVRLAYVLQQLRVLNELHRLLGYKKKSLQAPPQPSVPERLTRFFTGIKVYRYDIEKAKRSLRWKILEDLKALKIGLKRAEKYGRIPEQERIAKQIEKIKKKLKELD